MMCARLSILWNTEAESACVCMRITRDQTQSLMYVRQMLDY